MEQRDILLSELQAIISACKRHVKQLRRHDAHIMAAHFSNLATDCSKIAVRNDFLLPTLRRVVRRQLEAYAYHVELAKLRYPDVSFGVRRERLALPDRHEPTRTVRVSITLFDSEWEVIDRRIKDGISPTLSGYFRKLHMDTRR